MKSISLIFLFVMLGGFVFADNPITVTGKIDKVTVFRQGAKLNGTATASIASGAQEIIITNMTNNAVQQSLQVKLGSPQVHLLSATFRFNYLKVNAATARVKTLSDSLVTLNRQINAFNDQAQVNRDEIEIIKKTAENRLGGTEKGASFEDLKNVADFYQKHLNELLLTQRKIAYKLEETEELKYKYDNTLQNLRGETTKVLGEIVLKIDADAATTFQIDFSLFTTAASWTPLYDLKASEGNKPLQLIYKANIQQSSGYDWNDVQLFVSSGNPNLDNTLPKLEARYVDFLSLANDYRVLIKTPEQSSDGHQPKYSTSTIQELMPPPPGATDAGATVEMEISRKQTIPTDGQIHLLEVNQYEIPVAYEYQTVPRRELSAFLLAKITDFGQYNLLEGTANLFFNDTYVGRSDIKPNVTTDTLFFSMGRDEKVVVKRAQLKDVTSTKFLSNTKKETIAYETTVRNNKSIPIDLEIVDNIPISRQKDIVVEVEEKSGGVLYPDFGETVWNIHLNPGETRKINLVYSIKYPKNQPITFGLESQHVRLNRAMQKR